MSIPLLAVLLVNQRTRELLVLAVSPLKLHSAEEEKKRISALGSYYIISCVTCQWTCFLFFSSAS